MFYGIFIVKSTDTSGVFYFFRPGDLLLGVNKKSLKNKTQKKVLKIFRKIRPRADRKIYIELVSVHASV